MYVFYVYIKMTYLMSLSIEYVILISYYIYDKIWNTVFHRCQCKTNKNTYEKPFHSANSYLQTEAIFCKVGYCLP